MSTKYPPSRQLQVYLLHHLLKCFSEIKKGIPPLTSFENFGKFIHKEAMPMGSIAKHEVKNKPSPTC